MPLTIKVISKPLEQQKVILALESSVNNWQQNFQDETADHLWQDKINNTLEVIYFLKTTLAGTALVTAFYEECPVGVMQMVDVSDSVFIEYIVTHPASSGVGGALIEDGLNLITEAGYEAQLKLETPYEGAKKAYIQLGFSKVLEESGEYDEDNEILSCIPLLFGEEGSAQTAEKIETFVLDPQRSNRWFLTEEGKWKLTCSS